MLQFFDVTLSFLVAGHRIAPVIKHVPALDEADASAKALGTATARLARDNGATVNVVRVTISES